MREIPLIFSGPMVQAIMAGRKSMTRRLEGLEEVNDRLGEWQYEGLDDGGHRFRVLGIHSTSESSILHIKPRFHKGDRIWVKETHWRFGRWVADILSDPGHLHWRFEPVKCPDEFLFDEVKPQGRLPRDQIGYHKSLERDQLRKALEAAKAELARLIMEKADENL